MGKIRSYCHLLVLNPNSSTEITKSMMSTLGHEDKDEDEEGLTSFTCTPYTAPSSSPSSINNAQDLLTSTTSVLQDLTTPDSSSSDISHYSAILIACFSVHPLVSKLPPLTRSSVSILGIFEASILTAQSLLRPYTDQKWGIVTTGTFWEDHLNEGVRSYLSLPPTGSDNMSNFAGVFSTGLTAGDFHNVSPKEVEDKLREATSNLLNSGNVTCVVMGCAGMAGLEDIIRSTALEVHGAETMKKEGFYVVDGVRAGVMQLEQMMKSKESFA